MTKPTYPVGVSVLLTNPDGRVALGWRSESVSAGGLLSTPGGRIEVSERLEETAARELYEETGVNLKPSEFTVLGFKEHFRFDSHYFMVYVTARSRDDVLECKEPDKCTGWQWWNVSEIPLERCTEPGDILQLIERKK